MSVGHSLSVQTTKVGKGSYAKLPKHAKSGEVTSLLIGSMAPEDKPSMQAYYIRLY